MPSAPQQNNKKSTPRNSQNAMQNINNNNKQNQKNNPSNKNIRKKVTQPARSNDIRAQFYNALTNPFDPNSMGCQVPDPFPFPTATFHVHQTTVIGNTTGTSGSVAFLPNPVFSMVDLTQINNLVAGSKVVQNTPFNHFGSNTSYAASALYGAVSPTALSSVFSDFRVVSWGIKISNLQPQLSATGRMMIAMIPIGDTIPSYPILSNSGIAGVVTPVFGMDPQYVATSNILELPTGFEITVGDLLHGDLEVSGMYTNSEFWTFKTSVLDSNPVDNVIEGDDVALNLGGGTLYSIGYKDMTRSKGGAAIVIYYEGMPSATQNCFQVETIYHLEGTPNFSGNANNALISSTNRKTNIGSTNVVEQVMARASKIENTVSWITKGAQFLNDNKSTIFKVGGAIAAFL